MHGPDRLAIMTRLAQFVRDYDLAYISVRQGDFAVEMTQPGEGVAATPPEDVLSPASGTVLFRHASQSAPLTHPGAAVAAGQVVALIADGACYEAVRAKRAGVVATICKSEGETIGKGERLLQLASLSA